MFSTLIYGIVFFLALQGMTKSNDISSTESIVGFFMLVSFFMLFSKLDRIADKLGDKK